MMVNLQKRSKKLMKPLPVEHCTLNFETSVEVWRKGVQLRQWWFAKRFPLELYRGFSSTKFAKVICSLGK